MRWERKIKILGYLLSTFTHQKLLSATSVISPLGDYTLVSYIPPSKCEQYCFIWSLQVIGTQSQGECHFWRGGDQGLSIMLQKLLATTPNRFLPHLFFFNDFSLLFILFSISLISTLMFAIYFSQLLWVDVALILLSWGRKLDYWFKIFFLF